MKRWQKVYHWIVIIAISIATVTGLGILMSKSDRVRIAFYDPIREEEYDLLKAIANSIIDGSYDPNIIEEQGIKVNTEFEEKKLQIQVVNEKRYITVKAVFPVEGELSFNNKNVEFKGKIDSSNSKYEKSTTVEGKDYYIMLSLFEGGIVGVGGYMLFYWLPITLKKLNDDYNEIERRKEKN